MSYQKNEKFVMRKVHDTYFFIDITDNYNDDKCRLIETNEIGAFIWNQLTETADDESITTALMHSITEDVPYEIILSDVKNYLQILELKGIIQCRRD